MDALKLKLMGTERTVVKRYTDNTEAYQLYLKGRFFVNRRTSESLRKAIEYFNQAISLDSNYALGYAGLADAYLVLAVPDAVTEALSPQDALPKARAAAEKALLIDNSVAEVYATLAHVKWKERDWAGAKSDYERSIKLNPKNPIAHFYYAVYLAGLGRRDEAVREIRRAQELDPLSLPVNARKQARKRWKWTQHSRSRTKDSDCPTFRRRCTAKPSMSFSRLRTTRTARRSRSCRLDMLMRCRETKLRRKKCWAS